MKTPSALFAILSLILLPALPALDAQESNLQPAPAESPAASQPKVQPTVAAPAAMPGDEALRLVGVPRMALQLEPALAAAVQLTPEQHQSLKQAREETVEQAKKEMAAIEDKKVAYRTLVNAQNEYALRRDSIIGDHNVTLLNAIQAALIEATEQAKQAQPEPGKTVDMKALFLKELKPTLNADQVALVEAAGGKLP